MKFIVAEMSKNWTDGVSNNGDQELIGEIFERVIAVNDKRGYRLHSFQLSQTATVSEDRDGCKRDHLSETIVAVFEQVA